MSSLTATAPGPEPISVTRPRPARVAGCYSVMDAFFPRLGLLDLTDGIYDRSDTSYEQAQANQIDYLLDEIRCGPGDRLLDIGCGYGTLLARARDRGIAGVGITLSGEQAEHCRRAGLDARVLDYRELGPDEDGGYDAVVANGSLEHFVQPADAAAGRDDEIYRHLFWTVRRLIDRGSPARRFVTTAIHFVRRPAPADLLRHPLFAPRGSDAYHYALMARALGGWYPAAGQLERCAAGYFDLVAEVDGTEDYRRTSEEWLTRVRRGLRSVGGLKVLLGSLPTLLRHPVQYPTLVWCMLVSESWNWQFRPPAPTRLLRQTWDYRD
jgi:cyclopropane fatty-acyl-phospholipid synthase-like methyltransferase